MPLRGQIQPGLPVTTRKHLKTAESLNESVDGLLTVLEDQDVYPAHALPRRQVNAAVRALVALQESIVEGIRHYHDEAEENADVVSA